MNRTKHLKVAISAGYMPGKTGGVAQATIGLIHALGQLDDGFEEYTIVVRSQAELDWLEPYTGPNQRFAIRLQSSEPRERNSLKRALRPLARYIRSFVGTNSNSWHWPEIPVSDGFYESLGCDIVHFPHQMFILCALPTIFNPHDLQHLHYPQFFTVPNIAWRETIYPGGCRFAHTVVVASQWIKDDIIQQYHVSADKVQVIPWGAPTIAYPEPSQEYLLTVKHRYQIEQPFAFYPAVTWPHKNHIGLLEALAYLRDERALIVRLVCTGSRDEPFWAHIKKRLDELRLWPQVKFLGFIPEKDLRAIYQLSEFVVMPTLFESDSFPIYEAWLEGTPVACSNVTSLPDQVKDAALIFNPNDLEGMADAIAQMAKNLELRQKLSNRGYQRLNNFDWKRTGKAYRAVYRRAAGYSLSKEDQRLLSWDWMREPKKEVEDQL